MQSSPRTAPVDSPTLWGRRLPGVAGVLGRSYSSARSHSAAVRVPALWKSRVRTEEHVSGTRRAASAIGRVMANRNWKGSPCADRDRGDPR